MLSPSLSSSGTGTGGGGCPLKGGVRVFCPECPDGGGRWGGQVLPRIVVTCPGSQGTSCSCSPFMTREEVPGSSLVLCLGPGPSSLLHLTRANAEKPYAGDTSGHIITFCEFCMHMFTKWDGTFTNIVQKVKVIFCKYHLISI